MSEKPETERWRCAGCGIEGPDTTRLCDCATNVVCSTLERGRGLWKTDPKCDFCGGAIDSRNARAKLAEPVKVKPLDILEISILQAMIDGTPDGYWDGYYFPFKWIKSHVDIDIEVIRGIMKSMRNRGLVKYGHGFDEEGMTVGSGYSLTEAGRTHHAARIREDLE